MRCFIAIDLPDEIRKELVKVQAELPKENTKLLAVKPENIHLTLKFLGEIDGTQENKIKKILEQLKLSKFTAKLSSVGIFSLAFVRVVWVGLEPKEEFVKIHNMIDNELEKIGFRKDKIWETHVTAARVKWLKNKEDFIKSIEKIKVKQLEFNVNNIKLKKSTLVPEGPVYEDIVGINL